SVVYGENSFLAAGYHSSLLSSYDSVFWNQPASAVNASFAGAFGYRGRYIAYGDEGSIWISGNAAGESTTYLDWLAFHLTFDEVESGYAQLLPGETFGGDVSNLLKYAMRFALDSPVALEDMPRAVGASGGETTPAFV